MLQHCWCVSCMHENNFFVNLNLESCAYFCLLFYVYIWTYPLCLLCKFHSDPRNFFCSLYSDVLYVKMLLGKIYFPVSLKGQYSNSIVLRDLEIESFMVQFEVFSVWENVRKHWGSCGYFVISTQCLNLHNCGFSAYDITSAWDFSLQTSPENCN